jgi:hypothetical protein
LPDADIDVCGESSLVATGMTDDGGIIRYSGLEQTTPSDGCPLVELCGSDQPDAARLDLDEVNARLNDPSTPTEACDSEGRHPSYECPVNPDSVDRSTTCNADTDCAGYQNGAVCATYCVDTLCSETARGCASRYDCTGVDDDPLGCDTEVIYHCTADEDWGSSSPSDVTDQLPPRDNVVTEIPEANQAKVTDYLELAKADRCNMDPLGSGNAENGNLYLDPTPQDDETFEAAQDREAPVDLGSASWGLFMNPRLYHTVALEQRGMDQFHIDLRAEGSLIAGARVFGKPRTAIDVNAGASITECGITSGGKFQIFGETVAAVEPVDTESIECENLASELSLAAGLLREAALFTRQIKAAYDPNDGEAVCDLFIYAFDLANTDPDFDCDDYGPEQLVNAVIARYESIAQNYADLRADFLEAAAGTGAVSEGELVNVGESFSLVGVHAPIPIGPLSLVVDAQLYGSWFIKGGVDYELDMEGDPRASAGAVITPGLALETSLYVGIGIDLGVAGASVGLEGVLKLIEVDAPVRVSMGVERETLDEADFNRDYQDSDFAGDDLTGIPNGSVYRWSGGWDFGAGFGLTSLSGDLNAAARVHFLFFSKTFRKKIAHWEGFPKEYFPVASANGSVDVGADGLLTPSSTFADTLAFGDFSDVVAFTGIDKVGAGAVADYPLSAGHLNCGVPK